MHAERTPNPNSIKWVLGQTVAEGVASASFSDAVAADVSPLASPILAIDGVEAITLGPNFVTVSKTEGAEWTELAAPIVAEIKAWAGRDEPALGAAFEPPQAADEDEVVARIREILERDVRPYVESDGGEATPSTRGKEATRLLQEAMKKFSGLAGDRRSVDQRLRFLVSESGSAGFSALTGPDYPFINRRFQPRGSASRAAREGGGTGRRASLRC